MDRLRFLSLCTGILVDMLKHKLSQITHRLFDFLRHPDLRLIHATYDHIMDHRVQP